jgi:hypothetical protein
VTGHDGSYLAELLFDKATDGPWAASTTIVAA